MVQVKIDGALQRTGTSNQPREKRRVAAGRKGAGGLGKHHKSKDEEQEQEEKGSKNNKPVGSKNDCSNRSNNRDKDGYRKRHKKVNGNRLKQPRTKRSQERKHSDKKKKDEVRRKHS